MTFYARGDKIYNLSSFDKIIRDPVSIGFERNPLNENSDNYDFLYFGSKDEAKKEFEKIKRLVSQNQMNNDRISKLEQKIEELSNTLLYITAAGYQVPCCKKSDKYFPAQLNNKEKTLSA